MMGRDTDSNRVRGQIEEVFEGVLSDCDPGTLLRSKVELDGETLRVGDQTFTLSEFDYIDVVGAGKASAPMAAALENLLSERIRRGLAVVPEGHTVPTNRIELVEASHPVPDRRSVRAAKGILDICRQASASDLVIVLISGGGSALMAMPAEELTLEELQEANDLLVKSGAPIDEINAVRKHLSAMKGGRLAQALAPTHWATLLISDVIGDDLSTIASGPTAGDTTTFEDALRVIDTYQLTDRLPHRVIAHLERGRDGQCPETPGPRDAIFERGAHVMLGSAKAAAEAAREHCRALGWRTRILATELTGEAREVGRVVAAIAREESRRKQGSRSALVFTGETTVTVRGQGVGGRNQELALAAAIALDGGPDVHVASLATDGTDGPTDAAGAIVNARSCGAMREAGVSPLESLDDNDAFHALDEIGALVRTGPTLNNLNDLLVCVC